MSKIVWKKILTGIQVTSSYFHIGNYFAALHPLKELSKDNEVYLFIADYHSLNTVNSAEEMASNRKKVIAQFLALFKDYPNVKIFEQSSVLAIPHIALLIGSVTPMGLMNRAHKVKELRDAWKEMNLGTFYYPALMAADILTFDTDYVPVWKDQKQHLEFARDMAISFNKIYWKGLFKLPEPMIDETIPLVVGIDGKEKMSKSKDNHIWIFDEPKRIHKKVMKIVTGDEPYADPKDPDKCNVYSYIKLFASPEQDAEIRSKYLWGEFGYGNAKSILIELMDSYFKKEKELYSKFLSDENAFSKAYERVKANNFEMDGIASQKLKLLKIAVWLA